MATIPNQATGLRLARKTITFTGAANLGAVGVNELFTTTGIVRVEDVLIYCSTSLEDAVDGAGFELGITNNPTYFTNGSFLVGAPFDLDTVDAGWFIDILNGALFQGVSGGPVVITISENIIMTISAQAITGGVLEFYALWRPLSDDGALAGDDIDLELGAYLADKILDEALSGHTTAGSAGKAIADIETDVDAVLVDTSTTLQAELDGIQADTEDIQTRLPAALVGGRIDANASAISGDTTAADRLEALMDGIVPGVVGASSTVTSVANCTGFTEATNDHFNGRLITFLTGNLAGQQCQITDYTGSTQSFTVTPLTEAPASSDTFVIH